MSIEPQNGVWYIVVDCAHCQSMIILFRDLTNGTSTLNATYYVVCPHCRQEGAYVGRHYQHASNEMRAEIIGQQSRSSDAHGGRVRTGSGSDRINALPESNAPDTLERRGI